MATIPLSKWLPSELQSLHHPEGSLTSQTEQRTSAEDGARFPAKRHGRRSTPAGIQRSYHPDIMLMGLPAGAYMTSHRSSQLPDSVAGVE